MPAEIQTFRIATANYERWLAERIRIVPEDLREKHHMMKAGVFPFLRATFYRWAQLWPTLHVHGLDSPATPEVLAVGDLHLENFGTWRDAEARLVWGINDFDEACRMPYSIDLVRLATSALVAAEAGHLKIHQVHICTQILKGYREGLLAGGMPFVLGEKHGWLLDLVRPARPVNFWEKTLALKPLEGDLPKQAASLVKAVLPEKGLPYRVSHRAAGLGSRGRRRFVAVADFGGGHICREVKELAPSAWWRARSGKAAAPRIQYQRVLDAAVRVPDPFVRAKSGWMVRRLAPDCTKIDFAAVPQLKEKDDLMFAMGWETANIHLGSKQQKPILRDLDRRPKDWLHDSAVLMRDLTRSDWVEWCQKGSG